MKKIIVLHLAGNSIADISREIGKDYNTVKRIVNRVWKDYEK